METNQEIGQRIVELRKALGLTQKQFGERLNISKTYIGSMELNKRRVNDRIIKIIAFTYNVNEGWLKQGIGAMFTEGKDHKLEEVIHNFKKLDGLLQDYVLKQIRLALEYQESKPQD